MRKPTIYEALYFRLQRKPTGIEVKAEVKRILTEGLIEQAAAGKLIYQRKRARSI